MPENTNQLHGFLIVDKPAGITSHDVVDFVQKLIPKKAEPRGRRRRRPSVGHGGTLDPFATGVLLVAMGSATRLLEYAKDFSKTYEAEITLGAVSDTDDVTGKITPQKVAEPPSLKQVNEVLKQFIGSIQQIPPAYSAVKFQGKKLYEYARRGQGIVRHPRPIMIYSIKLISYQYPLLQIEVECGSGTYIRALGRDIGEKLGFGGYVSYLRRKVIHKFHISMAIPLDKLSTDSLTASLLPSERLIDDLPAITLSPENVAKFKKGQSITLQKHSYRAVPAEASGEGWEAHNSKRSGTNQPIAIFDSSRHLLGISYYDAIASLLHPKKVL